MRRVRRLVTAVAVAAVVAAATADGAVAPAAALGAASGAYVGAAEPAALVGAADPGATAATLADAYVTSASPTSAFGTAPKLRADGSPEIRSYLRFDVGPLSGGVVAAATLQVYALTSAPLGIEVHGVASTSWPETKTTWATAPPVDVAAVGASGPVSAGSWVSIDVTALAAGGGVFSLALTTPAALNVSFASRESGATAPRVVLATVADPQPAFPIRATFYYPWFPEAWRQQGLDPFTRYTPTAGRYDSSDTALIEHHLAAFAWAHIQAGISSWWGIGSRSDARLGTLLATTDALDSRFRWAIYYERESQGDPTVDDLVADLSYVRDRYGSDPAYLRVGRRFVVFVYSTAGDGCGMVDRWHRANAAIGDAAYVVLKIFSGARDCPGAPDAWHQYGPAVAESKAYGDAFAISPGFYKANEPAPRLPRDPARWQRNIADMIASHAPWQLVETFNEWGEGTAVESAAEWESPSGYGVYLDALHDVG